MDDIKNTLDSSTNSTEPHTGTPETTMEPASPPSPGVTVSQPQDVSQPETAPAAKLYEPVVESDPLPPASETVVVGKPASSKFALWLILALFFVLVAGLGGYFAGKQTTTKSDKPSNKPVAEAILSVPTDATIISQCAIGRGTQYTKPKDLPLGPVYNFYKGKVIGIEFMVGKDELLTQNKSFLDLPLLNQKYDHVNIGLLSQGHSGFASPHYHVDIMFVPKSVTDQITCKT